MDRAVRNVTKFSDWSLRNAVRAATLNPTRAVGLADQGKIAVGAVANLTVLTASGEVIKTIIGGNAS
jgi:N-acetylglucosamine-6-phosphate deacetylase